MKNIAKGQKISLLKETGLSKFKLGFKWEQPSGYETDISIFMLSERGKIEEESDFIFYNQPQSSCGSIKIETVTIPGYQKTALIDTAKIPANVSRLMAVITIDNSNGTANTFENIRNLTIITADEQNNPLLQYHIEGLTKETAVIAVEIYKHNGEWKLQAVGNGFYAGLAALLKEYGSEKVQIQEEQTPVQAPKPTMPSLEKLPVGSIDFVKKHKERIDLAKKQVSNLGISGQRAQVILAMDISFSMNKLFKMGVVQDTFDRVMPLAMQFDDDGSIDVWLFHDDSFNHDVPFTLENRENFVNVEIMAKYNWGATQYAPVMNDINRKYREAGKKSPPAFVLFFTDGNCSDKRNATDTMRNASANGIFWKFIGMGGKKNTFEFLERLDDLSDRVVDNADFFHVTDLEKITDEQLYKNLLEEFPTWLKDVKSKGIIND